MLYRNRAPCGRHLGGKNHVNKTNLFERVAVVLSEVVTDILLCVSVKIYVLIKVVIPEAMLGDNLNYGPSEK